MNQNSVCQFFTHFGVKGVNPHYHICGNKLNVTHRCGFDKDDEVGNCWLRCPICQIGKVVK